MKKEEIVKYLIEKGYPVTTGGDIPTFEQSMQAMTDLCNYKKNEWMETACKWLNDNIFEYPWWDDDAPSFNENDIVKDFRKAMEE